MDRPWPKPIGRRDAACRAAASRDDLQPVFADRFRCEPACYAPVPAELPGFCPGDPGDPTQLSAYSVSKAAVVKFTENLAAEAGRDGIHVFSVHPGILPIGLSEAALAGDPLGGSAEARMHSWVRQQLAEGRGADPASTASLVIQLAAGRCDALSGRHLSVHDDIDALLSQIDRIRGRDLYLLRTRSLPL